MVSHWKIWVLFFKFWPPYICARFFYWEYGKIP